MGMANKKLTAKQARFVNEYLIDLNATQAAIRAGYSEKTAGFIGYENLKKPQIGAAVAQKQKKMATDQGVTPEEVVSEVAKIAFAKLPKKEKVRYSDKQKALELLAKYLGMFEKHNKQKTDSLVDVLKEIAKRSAPLVRNE